MYKPLIRDPLGIFTGNYDSHMKLAILFNHRMKPQNNRFESEASRHKVRLSSFVWRFSLICLWLAVPKAFAQWQTQTVDLKLGWNAIYLHVDASHESLTTAPPPAAIDEVWLWKPVMSSDRFIEDPSQPVSGNDWSSWKRSDQGNSSLVKLVGNVAYLVKCNADTVWNIQGKPVVPQYQWTSRGVNLIGFSTPQTNPPNFNQFLTPAQRLASRGEFYRYDDGDGDLSPSLFNALFGSVKVTRGEAYWIRQKDEFNRYFGAFDLVLQGQEGIRFGSSGSQHSLRIRNATQQEITVTLTLLDSETPPVTNPAQTAIAGAPPILVRGAVNTSNLTYAYSSLRDASNAATPHTVTLKPRGEVGSEAEVVLGINRSVMTGNAGDLFAGILRLTDSLGYTQTDLPISAEKASSSGLWVGDAVVNQVNHYLKNYQKDADNQPVTDSNGRYTVTSTDTSAGTVARPFNLRLIIHRSDTEALLLQHVFHGIGKSSQPVITTKQSLLDAASLASARRISATHLPYSTGNTGWALTGSFAQGQSVTGQVDLSFSDHGSNPFLHTFHPDHDNLNATFDAAQPRGNESYDVSRSITLNFSAASDDFDSLVSGGNQMLGTYEDHITFKGKDQENLTLTTSGGFVLRRISEIATLTNQ
jgi:hypothetical protein